MSHKHKLIIGEYEYTVALADDGRAYTYRQPINPKTGKGWQAKQNGTWHATHSKGMFHWCKLTRKS